MAVELPQLKDSQWRKLSSCRRTAAASSTVTCVGTLVLISVFVLFVTLFPVRRDATESSFFLASASSFSATPNESALHPVPVREIHIMWIGAKPLRAVGLAAIDSVARSMPSWAVRIHITIEDGMPDEVLAVRKAAIETQMSFFRDRGLDIKAVYHDDIETELKGSIFEGMGIKQRNVAGAFNVTPHAFFGSHTKDFLEAYYSPLLGGMFMDDDNIVMRDIEPVMNRYGPTLVTYDQHNLTNTYCSQRTTFTGWYTTAREHPLLKGYERSVQRIMSKEGVDCVLPWNATQEKTCHWAIIGPNALAETNRELCKSEDPPEIVNELVDDRTLDRKAFIEGQASSAAGQKLASYAIINRKYGMGGHWSQKHFLTEGGDLTERLTYLTEIYNYHIFGFLKHEFYDFIRDPVKYPLMYFFHQASCKFLCHPHSFEPLLPWNLLPDPSTRDLYVQN